ncbi:hypothetical protein OIU92_27305 [Escherichia coli]|nr:hypothetical protein [Escherichia coli]
MTTKTDVSGDGKPDTHQSLTREQIGADLLARLLAATGCDQWPDGVWRCLCSMRPFGAGVKKAIGILRSR